MIVISSYAPSRTTLPAGTAAASPLTVVEVRGSYPFDDAATIVIRRAATRPHSHDRVRLRVPCYSDGLTVNVSSTTGEQVHTVAAPCGFHDVALPAGASEVEVRVVLQYSLRTRVWPANSSAPGAVEVHRGPLTFALRPKEHVESDPINGSAVCATHKVSAASAWNYALVLPDPTRPERSLSASFNGPVPSPLPFSTTAASAIRVRAKARRVPQWTGQGRAPHPPPPSPVTTSEPLEEVELVPFGATNVRISVFPRVDS